ncbi:hypothetical protein L1987_39322 [Smallanthus sonchifolius]|uniref:Uncharacterized protein n=1 Tax=Smallanthus sonchifolius TaxID=185202 RepID=A0ACB9HL28_9ASTR|nr:hypothetical protein L1987_39322 [Smallanthus sonchifolius]
MMLPSSSKTVSHHYDVFMSFRGEDTRNGFTSHLYDALTRNDIRTYKDDKTLEIGRPIASEFLEAIETSAIAVVVLSREFATSKWCLEEIAKIAECLKRGKLIVIPIFYHVSPSDVRHQSNCFAQGFADHEADPAIATQKVDTWRAAFGQVGAISGLHVTQDMDEAEVVRKIVSKILRDMPGPMPLDLPNSLVGIKSRVDEVKRILRMESSEVLFIGICGMSGIGRNKDLVKDILTNIGLYAEHGITDLINKCLITINLEDSVWMHDLLQQMCWKILCTESDLKHIAIKSHEDVVEVLSNNPEGTHIVEVINQESYKGEVNDSFIIDPMHFSKMKKLKFLRISNVHFPRGLGYLSNDLRILEWYGCSLKSLPSMFRPTHIYELEMCSSKLKTLWKKDLELPNLRSVNLSFSTNLTEIPDLTSTSNLVKLNLEGCTSLTWLHASVLLHKRLRYLNLIGCTCLENLGKSCMEMETLEALLLSGCSKLEYIPEFGKNMKRLEHLYVDGTRIKKLPENIGEMCDLRNLDASGTFIEELPSSIYHLRKLRLLCLNRCRLSFKTGCFLNPSLDTLSSGLKEVDLSYCNLSVVPDGIGLLCHLITLDLSGNEFVSLPASIGLLSKLRMLCLNDCKRLQSLPKLSLVDNDMDYGPRSRFNYYVSTEGVDVSKFHASNYNNRPTVSCLNCPKLAVDKRGSYLAEKILNSYLELRTKYWMIPEAVFEIVGAGSEIPSGFVQPGSDGLILEGPWIGVAICAVISVHNFDVYMESKYTVTAHIHLGWKHWKISVPINFMVAELETQLVFYWTEADDLQRIVGSSKKSNFGVSFSVDPEDSNLHVTEFGVSFIHKEYIMRLKQHEYSINRLHKVYLQNLVFYYNLFSQYIASCEDDRTRKIVDFIFDYQRQQGSLQGIYQISKALLEFSQDLFQFNVYKKDRRDNEYFERYCVASLGASVLFKDFVGSVKDINDGWLSVKLALEQIIVKSRADGYSNREMLQHLNDLEAAHSVEFSDKFIELSDKVFWRIIPFWDRYIRYDLKKVFTKMSSITIAGIICMMANTGYLEHLKLKGTKDEILTSLRPHPYIDFKTLWASGPSTLETHNNELQVSEFYDNGILLQKMMNKMGRSSCLTKENEEEMMSVIDKLQNNIHKVSNTIQDMNSYADQYSHNIGKAAKKHFKSFSKPPSDDDIMSMLLLFNKKLDVTFSFNIVSVRGILFHMYRLFNKN